MKKRLKLFVWTDHNSDYTAGLAFAIAKDEAQARELVIASRGGHKPTQWGELEVLPLSKAVAFSVSGGG